MLLALSAAVTEEATYRGFLLGWAVSTFGATGTVLAIAIATSGLIFGLMHGYQERSRQLKIMVLSIGFGILYVVSGSLWLPILLHALIDLSMNWIGIPIMAGSGEREQATG